MGTDLSGGNGHKRDCAFPSGVTEWGGGWDFPPLPQAWPLATFIGNKRKIELKET